METYTRIYNALNRAKASQDKQGRKVLDLTTLHPKNFSNSPFGRGVKNVENFIKMLYDALACHDFDPVQMLRSVANQHNTCEIICDARVTKVYICEFTQTKTMLIPNSQDDTESLFRFIDSLVNGTEFLSKTYIRNHKKTMVQVHNYPETTFTNLRNAFRTNNTAVMETFAAVFVWMLNTKFMSKYLQVFTSAAASNVFTNESRILRNKPKAVVIQPNREEEISSGPAEESKKPIQPEGEVPDYWELATNKNPIQPEVEVDYWELLADD